MNKKFWCIMLCFVLMLTSCMPVYAASESELNGPRRGNKFINVSVYVGPVSGTLYNAAETRRVTYTGEHYEVCRENVRTGVRNFLYDKYVIDWKGFEKSGNDWIQVTSGHFTERTIVDATDIGNYLMSLV